MWEEKTSAISYHYLLLPQSFVFQTIKKNKKQSYTNILYKHLYLIYCLQPFFIRDWHPMTSQARGKKVKRDKFLRSYQLSELAVEKLEGWLCFRRLIFNRVIFVFFVSFIEYCNTITSLNLHYLWLILNYWTSMIKKIALTSNNMKPHKTPLPFVESLQ